MRWEKSKLSRLFSHLYWGRPACNSHSKEHLWHLTLQSDFLKGNYFAQPKKFYRKFCAEICAKIAIIMGTNLKKCSTVIKHENRAIFPLTLWHFASSQKFCAGISLHVCNIWNLCLTFELGQKQKKKLLPFSFPEGTALNSMLCYGSLHRDIFVLLVWFDSFFFVVVKNHHKLMYEFNLESAFLSCSVKKGFLLQIFRRHC